MTGCAQRALNTDINDATIRLLRRHGCEVVVAKGAGCCGALTHHMGKTRESHASAAENIRAWMREIEGDGLDGIVINTSGCGTTVKDYGHMFEGDPLAAEAARVAGMARDISEVMVEIGLNDARQAEPMRIAYHAACSLQHGQQIKTHPKDLLRAAGFEVVEPRDSHLCCGSAGTYNLMQPAISAELKARKVATLAATKPQAIAAGNIGCMMQIGSATPVPVVHTVELLDWATGGPRPRALPPIHSRDREPRADPPPLIAGRHESFVRSSRRRPKRRKSGVSGFQGGSGMRAHLASIGGLLAAAIALPASAQESLHSSVLAGHAVLPALSLTTPPADAPRDAWISGKFTGPARNEIPMSAPGDTGPMHGHRPTGLSLPFIGQPLQGFSGLAMNRAPDGSVYALIDNGYGGKLNSADALLMFTRLAPDWEAGRVAVEEIVFLADPDRVVPFRIVNEGSDARYLTGGDFDPESIQVAGDTVWIGEEFGPYLIRATLDGRVTGVFETLLDGEVLKSADHPTVQAPAAAGTDFRVARSSGYEGMALNPATGRLWALLEKPLLRRGREPGRQLPPGARVRSCRRRLDWRRAAPGPVRRRHGDRGFQLHRRTPGARH